MKRGVAVRALDNLLAISGGIALILFRVLGWPAADRTGKLTGHLMMFLRPERRRTVAGQVHNMLEEAVPEEQIKRIVSRCFVLHYQRQVESLFLGEMDKKTIEARVDAEGLSHIDRALAKGNGVILLLSHFGSFLLPPLLLGHKGYRVNQVAGRQINRSVFQERIWVWRKKRMDRQPVHFIQAEKFLRPLYKALKKNEIVTIAFDGRDSRTWVTVDFFGRKAAFSPGPFELARRTGATIIPAFTVKQKDHTHRIEFLSRFALAPAADREKAAARDTRNFAGILEGYIRQHPSHFGMIPAIVQLKSRENRQRLIFEEADI